MNSRAEITHERLLNGEAVEDDPRVDAGTCAECGQPLAAGEWSEVDPEHNPGWVMGPGDEQPWYDPEFGGEG